MSYFGQALTGVEEGKRLIESHITEFIQYAARGSIERTCSEQFLKSELKLWLEVEADVSSGLDGILRRYEWMKERGFFDQPKPVDNPEIHDEP
jgi:hypothetical protein